MIKREINIFLDEFYLLNKSLGGQKYKEDNRGKNDILFFQDYKNFQTKFYEIQNLQNQRSLLEGEKDNSSEMGLINNKISLGVKKLKDYEKNMVNIRKIIKHKEGKSEDQKKEASILDETLEKTKELIRIIEKQEKLYRLNTGEKSKNRKTSLAEGVAQKEEELEEEEYEFLNDWKNQMQEIVN